MATLRKLSFHEFSANLSAVLDRLVNERTPVVIRKGNTDIAVVRPIRSKRTPHRKKTAADFAAFLSAAGGWKDVNTEKLKKDIRKSRSIPPRTIPHL